MHISYRVTYPCPTTAHECMHVCRYLQLQIPVENVHSCTYATGGYSQGFEVHVLQEMFSIKSVDERIMSARVLFTIVNSDYKFYYMCYGAINTFKLSRIKTTTMLCEEVIRVWQLF